MRIFALFDYDQTGTITVHDLRRVARELGETMSVEELKDMLERAASDSEAITPDDFYFIMTKKTFAWFATLKRIKAPFSFSFPSTTNSI